MSLIQISILLFIFVVVAKTAMKLKRGDITFSFFVLWLLFWLAVATITLRTEILDWLAIKVGVGRGADLVVYLALLTLFYLLFKVSVAIGRIEKRISEIVRHRAKHDQ
jgi:hypothetical protein